MKNPGRIGVIRVDARESFWGWEGTAVRWRRIDNFFATHARGFHG